MLLVLIFPVLYMRQTLQFLPLAILGTLAALVAFVRLGDPIVFLQLILSPLTMFFFGYLLQTGNQVLHGFTTLAASSGVVFLAWGVHGGTTGATQPWMLVAAAVLVTAVVVVLLRPVLAGLPATPRPQALGK